MHRCVRVTCTLLTVTLGAACDNSRVARVNISDPADVILDTAAIQIGVNDEIMLPGWATRLPNGNIAIADAYLQAVLFFDPAGREIRRSGRRGFGPGEYQDLSWIAQCERDSLFVFDPTQSRITVMDTAGVMARQFMVPPASKVVCRNGTLAALMMPESLTRPDPSKPRERFYAGLQFLDTDGKLKAEVEKLPVGEYGPLAKVSGIALGDDRLWFGSADSAYLDSYNYKGKQVGTVGFGLPARRATDAYLNSDIDQQVKAFKDKATRESVRQVMKKFSLPEFLPALTQIVADPMGNVWIATSFPGDATTDLRVISEEGVALADVRLGRRIQIFEVGPDYILGSDEVDDQPRVVLYSFDPTILNSTTD
jgi:hypothetical protein